MLAALAARRPLACCTPWARRSAGSPIWLSPTYRRRFVANARLRPGLGRRAAPAIAEAGRLVLELPLLWLRPAGAADLPPSAWDGAELVEAAHAQGRGLVLPDAAPGLLRGLRAGLCRALRRAVRADHGAVPAGAQAWLRELMETSRAAARAGHGAGHARRRAPDDPRAAARRGGRPAAGPGAARRHGRVGAVLRQAGLHDDAGRAPGRSRPARCRWRSGASGCRGGAGYVVRVTPLGEAAAGRTPSAQAESAAVVNRAMERLIRHCPQQYLWGYHRYKQPRARAGRRLSGAREQGPTLGARIAAGPALAAALAAARRAGALGRGLGALLYRWPARAGASRCATSRCAFPS